MLTSSHHVTSKQCPGAELDGFSFMKERASNEKIYWWFNRQKFSNCHALRHTVLKSPVEHNCKFDATESHNRLFSQQVPKRVPDTQEMLVRYIR